jgi:hypothetical protein
MKKGFFFLVIIILSTNLFAQSNVGIGTNTPHGSALFEVSSTSKGLLTPRMTSAQRNAIVSPAKGLLVYDTDVNSLYHYNGSAWVNLAGGGGGFSLPFEANVNLNIPTFQILNAGSGDILYLGASNGSAITAYNTGNSAAISVNASNGFGIYAQSGNSIPVYGLVTNTNNTLAALRGNNTGGGVGLHASAQNNDGVFGISSAVNKVGVKGEATGTGGIGVYGSTTSNTGVGVSGFNAGGTAVLGTSTTNHAIRGVTSSGTGFSGVYGINNGSAGSGVRGEANFAIGIGVYGSSTAGTGVRGFSETNTGVHGQTNSGTALLGNSTTGYALETSGKVKIAGGNMNPVAGAVLTSIDAGGNAVWKASNRVAFKAGTIHDSYSNISQGAHVKSLFIEEFYDYGNNFTIFTGGTPNTNSSTFSVPVSGIYHFSASIGLQADAFNDFLETNINLMLLRGGTTSLIHSSRGSAVYSDGGALNDHAQLHFSMEFKLLAGDRVWLEVYQKSDSNDEAAIPYYSDGRNNVFSGYLVIAD